MSSFCPYCPHCMTGESLDTQSSTNDPGESEIVSPLLEKVKSNNNKPLLVRQKRFWDRNPDIEDYVIAPRENPTVSRNANGRIFRSRSHPLSTSPLATIPEDE